ncbi:MAG: epoxyqueuosine reductase QueH [Candidatus Firestonebacteria bacterium]|nr:epoxyqueuosine reductase QueH [Candidatus Firestonebacteria bacterium]
MNNSKKLLLHICCAPCLIYPYKKLKEIFPDFTGYFYNPNIYPDNEHEKRLQAVKNYSDAYSLSVIYDNDNNLSLFSKDNLSFEFQDELRCEHCYSIRLIHTANFAFNNNFTHFTTTLLFSIYQKHELIKKIAIEQAKKYGLIFLYEDFRSGWKEANEFSRKIGMYRQKYCGCISSLHGVLSKVK